MKRKTKNALLSTLIILVSSLLLWNCEHEESIIKDRVSETKRLNIRIESWDHWKEHHSQAAIKIEKFRKKNLTSKNHLSSEYGFTINEDEVQIIEKNDYKTYTFFVVRDNPQEGVLENYMYKEFADGSYKQYLLTYYYIIDSNGFNVLDKTDMKAEIIDDENLILNRNPVSGDCHPHFVESFDGWACTFRERCTGNLSHEIGDSGCLCTGVNQCYPAGETCEAQWSYVFNDCSGGGDTSGDIDNPNAPNNPPTGGGSGNEDNDEGDTDAVPLEEPINYAQEIIDCMNVGDLSGATNYSLSQAELDWINSALNRQIIPLYDFLFPSNSCDPSVREFSFFALDAFLNSQDPDVSLEVIFRLFNGFTKVCHAEIMYKAIEVNSPFVNTFRNDLAYARDNNIAIQDLPASQIPGNVNSAVTYYQLTSTPEYNDIVLIVFEEDYLNNASDLALIVTLYHEMVHATMVDLYHEGKLLDNYPNYTSLNTAFDNYFQDSSTINGDILDKEMHDIYIDFIDPIAESIHKYCQENNISSVDLAYAKKLVWGSLGAYDVFTENLTPTEQTEALNLLNNEQQNNNDAVSEKTCD